MTPLVRLTLPFSAFALLAAIFVPAILAQAPAAARSPASGIRIGVVDLNAALNNSEAGKRSKRILLTDKEQMEDELKAQESDLKKRADDLKNNVLLTESAKAQREIELKDLERKLRDAVQNVTDWRSCIP